jgi:hypothetical protein
MALKRHDPTQADLIGHYNPVNVTDTMGIIILGTLTFILLIALLRSNARNRALIAQLSDGAAGSDAE